MECIRQIEGTTDEFTIRGDFISTTSAEIAGHYEMEEVEGELDLPPNGKRARKHTSARSHC